VRLPDSGYHPDGSAAGFPRCLIEPRRAPGVWRGIWRC